MIQQEGEERNIKEKVILQFNRLYFRSERYLHTWEVTMEDMIEPSLCKGNGKVHGSKRGGRFGRQHPVVPNSIPRSSITNKANYMDNKRPTTQYRDRP